MITKYIKVGIDDPSRSDNSTFHNDSWSELNRSANAIARLANNSTQLFGYAVQPNGNCIITTATAVNHLS
ncbi:hypothetical protein TYRP_004682 [Tyrophagus putrescentiae]|nr:hypothetical protein TYRP_004682 [Tyrophagus putrescentiae]